jgi:TRAP transporter TAXI family solute receptor
MTLRSLFRYTAIMLASILAGCAAVSVVLAPTPFTLATGTPGGIYHPVGNAICRMFNLPDGQQTTPCLAVSSEGSVANIQRIETGQAAFALSQTDVAYAAYHGEGPFTAAGPDHKLRMLIALYPEVFTVIARADTGIRDFQDLHGRRIGIGKSGAGYGFTRDVVLGFFRQSVPNPDHALEFGPAEQNPALCNKLVDAIIFQAGHPNGLTQEATTGCPTRLVRVAGPPIDRLLAAHHFYTATVIPGGMYAGNPEDVATIGTQAVLVTSSSQPDRLAYAMVKAVFEHFEDFRRLHPALANLSIRDMVPSEAVIPIHPGALAYYREAGLMQSGTAAR